MEATHRTAQVKQPLGHALRGHGCYSWPTVAHNCWSDLVEDIGKIMVMQLAIALRATLAKFPRISLRLDSGTTKHQRNVESELAIV